MHPDPGTLREPPMNDETLPDENPEPVPPPSEPRWRPAAEPTCCGSGCEDCPF